MRGQKQDTGTNNAEPKRRIPILSLWLGKLLGRVWSTSTSDLRENLRALSFD